MKRLFVFVFLPVVIFALEPVNLIKDHGFEEDSELWQTYTGGDSDLDSAITNRHDPEKAFSGGFSGSCDTRPAGPAFFHGDSALVIQGFCCQKKVSDLDSLTLYYSLAPFIRSLLESAWIVLYIDAGKTPYWLAGYLLVVEGRTPVVQPPRKLLKLLYFPDDTSWDLLARNIRADLEAGGISTNATVDSFLVMGRGGYIPPWRGQKVYWDDVRLTGYADYDVGVKEILSPDSIGDSGDSLYRSSPDPMYQPVARIKNFGREPADTFLAIAEILNEYGLIYADTVPWSMDGDTEDTITFRQCVFEFPMSPAYTLIVRTVADPDECDEDDEVSRTLYYSAVAEPITPSDYISLKIEPQIRDGVLRVTYSLPYDKPGTLTLFDAAGRRIERMAVKGSGKVDFKSELPLGIYIVRLETKQRSITRKAVVLK